MNIEKYVASITLQDSGKSKVHELVELAIKGSPALDSFYGIELSGKYNYVPILHVPKATDTSFVVGGLDIEKEHITASGLLVDASIEDATANLGDAMDSVLTSQLRIKMEKQVADTLAAVATETGASAKNVATVVELLKKFDESVFLLEGEFIAFVNYTNYLVIMSTLTLAQKELMDAGVFTIKPMLGLGNDDMIVLHTYGARLGYQNYDIEKDRDAEKGTDTIIASGSVGFGVDTAYVKHVKLS